MATVTKQVRINDDEGFEEDLANFLGETYSTDEEGNQSQTDDDSKIQHKTVELKAPDDKDAAAFWKNPELPERYPLDHINVENLVNMLSKIHLVWPENLPYYNEAEFDADPDRAKYPSTFYHNSDKEKVTLWHAENFRRQYLETFPFRRPIVIAPRNECGVQKLFPTFIYPTALGYPEFLDCVSTVTFLKDFFSPDILNPPTKWPDRMRSHSTLIKHRKANAFEMSMVVVSVLRGIGYDAYVVDGFASKTLTTIDTTMWYTEPEEKPLLDYDIQPEKEGGEDSGGFGGLAGLNFGPDYSYLLEEEKEEPLVPVDPNKYRFKIKEGTEEEGGEGGDQRGIDDYDDIFGLSPSQSTVITSIKAPRKLKPENDEEEDGEEEEDDEEEGSPEDEEEEANEEEEEAMEETEEVIVIEDDGKGDEAKEEEEAEIPREIEWAGEREIEWAGEWEGEYEEEEEEQEEPDIFEELPEYILKERYHGMRIHAWILILAGSRDVEKPFFLEPFSGTYRELKDPNFLNVQAVFNEKNYWINLQTPVKNVKLFNWNLNDPSCWSKLLVESDRVRKKKKKETGAGDAPSGGFQEDDEEEDYKNVKPGDLFLTMPVSWTGELEMSQQDYDRKYPDGVKTIEYADAIVEVAAPYANPDGLVRKVMKFSREPPGTRDPEDLEYIEEKFMHRKDKLIKRLWLREGKMLHEQFERGRKDALKEHVHVSGRNKPDYPRDLYYYANAHPRGVAHRKIIKKGMVEYFEDRDDKLYFKTTLFGGILCNTIPTKEDMNKGKAREIMELVKGMAGGGNSSRRGPRRKIIKIIEKYDRDETKLANEDIAEKHLLIEDGRARVLYHYQKGNLTRNTIEFFKVPKPGQSKYAPIEFKPEDCIEYHANKDEKSMDIYAKFLLIQALDKDERTSSVMSRQAEDEIFHTVSGRVQEDWRHEVEPDAFAGDLNEEYLKMMREKPSDDDMDFDRSGMDITTPFFEKYGTPKNKREEILMKKRIMLHEKVKIMRRAYMIKELYDHEAATLREKQDWYQVNSDQLNQTQDENFSNMYKERLFQMHILEQRMVRHQQETPRLYYNLLVQLLRHPQLNRFTNRKIAPPPPPDKTLTEDERARIAKELAKLKDCCTFYNIRFTGKKKKPKEEVVSPVEDPRKAMCSRKNKRISNIPVVYGDGVPTEMRGDDDTVALIAAPGETEVAHI